jgi:hypothetical protein
MVNHEKHEAHEKETATKTFTADHTDYRGSEESNRRAHPMKAYPFGGLKHEERLRIIRVH